MDMFILNDKIDYEKYKVNKGKTDIVSSLKALDKKIIKEKMKQGRFDSIKELASDLLETFEMLLSCCKDDRATHEFMSNLLKTEGKKDYFIYKQDVENLHVFVYKKDDYYTYYVPDELKEIIQKFLED